MRWIIRNGRPFRRFKFEELEEEKALYPSQPSSQEEINRRQAERVGQ